VGAYRARSSWSLISGVQPRTPEQNPWPLENITGRVGKNYHLVLPQAAMIADYAKRMSSQTGSAFVGTRDAAFRIILHKSEGDIVSFYVYQGGKFFTPTVPEGQASAGEVLPVSIEPLPLDAFVESLPQFQLARTTRMTWLPDSVVAEAFDLKGKTLEMKFMQNNPFSTLADFTVHGDVRKFPGSSTNYGGAYVEFTLADYIGRQQMLRLRYNGFDTPEFQLLTRGLPYTVSMISFDGFRLSIGYSKDNKVATMHLTPPSDEVYSIGNPRPYSGIFLDMVQGRYASAHIIDQIQMARSEERTMLLHGDEYTIGRIGAEIAYVIATTKIGLTEVVLQEPSIGGRDLYTRDNKVAIQTTFIRHATKENLRTMVQCSLLELVEDIKRDFGFQPNMIEGFVIVSFVDLNGSLRSIVLKVARPRHLISKRFS